MKVPVLEKAASSQDRTLSHIQTVRNPQRAVAEYKFHVLLLHAGTARKYIADCPGFYQLPYSTTSSLRRKSPNFSDGQLNLIALDADDTAFIVSVTGRARAAHHGVAILSEHGGQAV